MVGDADCNGAVFLDVPGQFDDAAGWGIPHGVGHEVYDGAAQFIGPAVHGHIVGDIGLHRVRFDGHDTNFFRNRIEHARKVDDFGGLGLLFVFQARKCEQIVDKSLHATGLLTHEVQVRSLKFQFGRSLFVNAVERHIEKTREHGQRRSEFVRNVGDEITPHRVKSLLLGHVACNQDAGFAIHVHEANLVGGIGRLGAQDVGGGKVAGLDVVLQSLIGNEGQKVATCVVFSFNAEDFFGDIVAPRHRPV